MSLKSTPAAMPSRSARSRGADRRASVISVLPQITMPPREDWIRFWKARSGAGANQDATRAQRLSLLNSRIASIETVFDAVVTRCDAADAADVPTRREKLRAEHTRLTELQQVVGVVETRLAQLSSELDAAGPAFLAAWRVTERQILSTEARAMAVKLDTLMQCLKRHQVRLTGQIMDLG